MSQLIRSSIECGRGKRLIFKDQCHGIWCLPYLSLEELVNTHILRIVSFCRIPLHQQLLALLHGEERLPCVMSGWCSCQFDEGLGIVATNRLDLLQTEFLCVTL